MDWFQDMIDEPREFRGILPDARRTIGGLLDLEKPVICWLKGHAAGFGVSMASATQISDAAFAYEMLTNLSHNRQEAVNAFANKRAAKFEGE